MKFLSACARLLAGFFAILFIISALFSLLLFNAQWHFTNPDLYKRILLEERVYDSLPRLLSTQISAGITYNPCAEDPSTCEDEGEDPSDDNEGGPPDYFKNLDVEQWELLLREILTPDWLQTQAESVIDQTFDFLDSDDAAPSISISMVELKSRLMGRNGVDTVLKILDAQPSCSEDQLSELIHSFEDRSEQPDLLSCRPPQRIIDEYMPSIEETLNEIIGDLPNEAILGENFMDSDEPNGTREGELQIGTSLRRIRSYLRFSPIVPVIFLLLVAVFGVRSFRDLLRWWGIPFLLTGLIALVFSILSMPIFNWVLRTYVEGQIPGFLSMEFTDLGFELGRAAIRSYVKTITIQAGVLALAGVIAVAISAFMRPRRADILE
jgi:hypothetical protein